MIAREDRGMLVANLLSLARVPLALAIWAWPTEPAWVLSLLALAGLTDVLDGWAIRRHKAKRWRRNDPGAFAASVARGAAIDGFADKVFVVSAVGALWAGLEPAPWVLTLLVSRELLFIPIMVAFRLAPATVRDRVDFTAGVPGKAATIAQFVALVLGFLEHPLFVEAAIGAGSMGALATVYYVARVFVSEPDRPDRRRLATSSKQPVSGDRTTIRAPS